MAVGAFASDPAGPKNRLSVIVSGDGPLPRLRLPLRENPRAKQLPHGPHGRVDAAPWRVVAIAGARRQ